ncbi:cupin domain-containing protein [Brucella gallinifaecis]|uniref:cupin domain-containing protein n=1 Tax=Brucella gallinifaecis TaxID=215590 RepID=UPI00235E3486|nr:cupin domain-containing protein [Brucella gallinifaecis]
MSRFLRFDISTVEPEESAPLPERVLSGDPRFLTWNFEESDNGKLFAGIWESSPGKWHIEYDEWEYCYILSGRSIVTEEGGESRKLVAGDRFIIRPGFKGTWEVIETTRKDYVIRF